MAEARCGPSVCGAVLAAGESVLASLSVSKQCRLWSRPGNGKQALVSQRILHPFQPSFRFWLGMYAQGSAWTMGMHASPLE